MKAEFNHRTSESGPAPSGHRSAERDAPSDELITRVWLIGSAFFMTGLAIAFGLGGLLAGFGFSGLAFFGGLVIERAIASLSKS